MTYRAPLTALLGLLVSCGPADDAGPPPSRSTDGAATEAPAPPVGGEGPASAAAPPRTAAAANGAGDAPARVVFLGTSLTAGLGLLRDAERYTEVLQAMADSAHLPVELVNAGVSGETSAGGLRRLEWVLAEPLDVLVVELGANDGLRGIPVAAMRENLAEIVRRGRARWPDLRVLLVSMEAPPNLGPRYTADFRETFPAVAREEGAELAPFLLDGVAGVASLNQEDRIHPNPEGHRRIAENLWPHLERVVRDALEGEGR